MILTHCIANNNIKEETKMIGSQSSGAGAARGGNKPKRIEKELLQLRVLPREYKIGKRDSALGTLLHVIRVELIIEMSLD
jgi:hypothetical protein